MKKTVNRYVNDLRRFTFSQQKAIEQRSQVVVISIAAIFMMMIGLVAGNFIAVNREEVILLVAAAVIGSYMALNIGANDVAYNMGPAVGGKTLSLTAAVTIAALFESAGALLAGGDVVSTISKGIITPGEHLVVKDFQYLMLSALFSAALWINLATMLNAPVSTTHSIVGGVLGAGIAAAGMSIVNWQVISAIGASWVISPVFGGIVSASLLMAIKQKILNKPDRVKAARFWLPVLIAIMVGTFTAYMAMKGLKKIWKPSALEVILYSFFLCIASWFVSRPFINARTVNMENTKKEIYKLFHLPLLMGVSLLCFAHGANDVANAVGPLAAIASTINEGTQLPGKVAIPFWVMLIGALGIALGLILFGPKLIKTVGQKITRLNAPRAYCVALSSAITVLIATSLGLPVSSTHIAVGAIFGVGFLREFLEHPNRRKHRYPPENSQTVNTSISDTNLRLGRRLVRRQFLFSVMTAWFTTVPASALLAAFLYFALQHLVSKI